MSTEMKNCNNFTPWCWLTNEIPTFREDIPLFCYQMLHLGSITVFQIFGQRHQEREEIGKRGRERGGDGKEGDFYPDE